MAGAKGPEPAGGGPAWRGRCGPNPAGPVASPERPRTGRENGRRSKRPGVLPAAGCRAEGARGRRGSCGTSGPSSAGPGRAAPRQNVKGAAPARPPGDGRLPHTGANGRFCRRPGILCTRPRRRPRGSIRRGPAAPSSRKAGPTAVSPAILMNPRLSACRDGHARLLAGGRCLERRPLRRAAAAGHHFRLGAHPITPGRPPHRALPADVRGTARAAPRTSLRIHPPIPATCSFPRGHSRGGPAHSRASAARVQGQQEPDASGTRFSLLRRRCGIRIRFGSLLYVAAPFPACRQEHVLTAGRPLGGLAAPSCQASEHAPGVHAGHVPPASPPVLMRGYETFRDQGVFTGCLGASAGRRYAATPTTDQTRSAYGRTAGRLRCAAVWRGDHSRPHGKRLHFIQRAPVLPGAGSRCLGWATTR